MTRIIIALALALTSSAAVAQTTFRDAAGRVTGTARTGANGVTTFHDRSSFTTGRMRTDSNGTTTFYDAAGRVTGKASAARR